MSEPSCDDPHLVRKRASFSLVGVDVRGVEGRDTGQTVRSRLFSEGGLRHLAQDLLLREAWMSNNSRWISTAV
jgi:hypothetical protein